MRSFVLHRSFCSSSAQRMYNTLRLSALLLWVPHTLASLYVLATMQSATVSTFIYVLIFNLVAISLTYYVAVYKCYGDFLMIISWVLGVLNEFAWVAVFPDDDVAHVMRQQPLVGSSDLRLLWIVVSMLHGAIGGILCKMKDIDEDRYYPTHTIGERLYVVVPFCTGQWLSFILQNGWRGIVIENLTILLSLSMVGYCVVGYKLLQQHIQWKKWDIIGIVEELFTTSFGVVFTVVVLSSIFVTLLAIPFLKSLFSLNVLVSSVGILLECVVYEVA